MKWLRARLSSAINWLKTRTLKAKEWLVERWKATLIVIGVVIVPLILWKVPEWQVRAYHGRLDASKIRDLDSKDFIQLQKDLITAENNARATLAQIIGGLVVLLGLYATFKNVRVAEEGKLTERFSKAVELLGSDKLDVRLGGIYALERIARDSQKDHWTVMEVLTAFVREQSTEYKKTEPKTTNDQESEDSGSDKCEIRLREDIQAVMTVIGRRKWVKQERPGQVINLSNVFLRGANLSEAFLGGADLSDADLSKADLREADLSGANLSGANLSEADLSEANLSEADLSEANLSKADIYEADLSKAHIIKANLVRAYLSGADLREANLRVANIIRANLVTANLDGADLREANLSGANLSGADLSRADLSKADLKGARFKNANLRTVIGLTWEHIAEAVIYVTTKLPPELEERRNAEQAKKAAAPNQ